MGLMTCVPIALLVLGLVSGDGSGIMSIFLLVLALWMGAMTFVKLPELTATQKVM